MKRLIYLFIVLFSVQAQADSAAQSLLGKSLFCGRELLIKCPEGSELCLAVHSEGGGIQARLTPVEEGEPGQWRYQVAINVNDVAHSHYQTTMLNMQSSIADNGTLLFQDSKGELTLRVSDATQDDHYPSSITWSTKEGEYAFPTCEVLTPSPIVIVSARAQHLVQPTDPSNNIVQLKVDKLIDVSPGVNGEEIGQAIKTPFTVTAQDQAYLAPCQRGIYVLDAYSMKTTEPSETLDSIVVASPLPQVKYASCLQAEKPKPQPLPAVPPVKLIKAQQTVGADHMISFIIEVPSDVEDPQFKFETDGKCLESMPGKCSGQLVRTDNQVGTSSDMKQVSFEVDMQQHFGQGPTFVRVIAANTKLSILYGSKK